MNKQLKADLALLLVVMACGASYYMTDSALTETTSFALNAIRFLGAFFVAAILSGKKLKGVSRETLKYSMVIGVALCVCYIAFTFGVQNTSLSNSAFLCGLPVIFVPILQMAFFRKKPGMKIAFAVVLSLAGVMLMTLKEDFSINMDHLKGDVLCIVCSLAYAFDLIITERAVQNEKVDAYQLGVFHLGATGVLMLLGSLLLEHPPTVPQSGRNWFFIIFLTVFCTGVPFVLQAVAQQFTTANHVGIIFTLEPVFAAIVAYFLTGERLSGRGYLGAGIMILALLLAEVDFSALIKKKKGA